VDFFREEVCRGLLTRPQSIFLSLGITFCVSLLGFSKICDLLGDVLEIAYPALIALAITNIYHKLFNPKQGNLPFWITLGMSGIIKIYRVSIL
jgi:LIVCS family branched-chain amino acid:cation transporter